MYVHIQWDRWTFFPLQPPEIKEKRKANRPLVQVHQTDSRAIGQKSYWDSVCLSQVEGSLRQNPELLSTAVGF